MGYLHIENLYKPSAQKILMFKECYAMEKIHGTSAHVSWDGEFIRFFSGGESNEKFKTLFDQNFLMNKLTELGYAIRKVTIYGEAYGGKCQGMSHTYGPNLKFIAFDVCVDENNWLNVPEAEVCRELGIQIVDSVGGRKR